MSPWEKHKTTTIAIHMRGIHATRQALTYTRPPFFRIPYKVTCAPEGLSQLHGATDSLKCYRSFISFEGRDARVTIARSSASGFNLGKDTRLPRSRLYGSPCFPSMRHTNIASPHTFDLTLLYSLALNSWSVHLSFVSFYWSSSMCDPLISSQVIGKS